MKKLLSLILVILIILGNIPIVLAANQSGNLGKDITWTLKSNGELIISGTGNMMNYDFGINVPWYSSRNKIKSVTIEDGVTSIGHKIFEMHTRLEKIKIADTVTSIGNSAFRECNYLIEINMPNNLEIIGESAFDGCSSLKSISIPNSVTFLGEWAFANCASLRNVTIGKGITDIKDSTFWSCPIQYITIPENVNSIGHYAFGYCSLLKSINISPNIDYIEPTAIEGCTAYMDNSDNWYNGALYLGNHLMKSKKDISSCTVKDGTKFIAEKAFYNCEHLKTVTLPDSMETIREFAFAECEALTGVDFGGTKTIDNSAFLSCTSLKEIDLKFAKTIGENAFSGCSNVQNIHFPSSLEQIGVCAFGGFTSLNQIVLPGNLTDIGASAFIGCSNVKNISFNGRLKTIGENAFAGCSSVTKIALPYSIETIGKGAFKYCTMLEEVVLPDKGIEIGARAFYETSVYSSSHIRDDVYIGNHLIVIRENSEEFNINEGTLSIAQDAFVDHSYDLNLPIIIPESVTCIGDIPDVASSVIIAGEVLRIGDSAFQDCTSLKSVSLPDTIETIGSRAFQNCTSLVSVTLPQSLISIGDYAFYGCESLSSITFPDSLKRIGYCPFANCPKIKTISIDYEIVDITKFFTGYEENIYLGKSVEDFTAYSCSNLKNISVSSENPKYSSIDGVLYNKDKTILICYPQGKTAEAFKIPDTVTHIEKFAFSDNPYLKKLTLPENVQRIEYLAIDNCENLKEITVLNPYCEVLSLNLGTDGLTVYGYTNSSVHDLSKVLETFKFIALDKPSTPENPSAGCSCNCHAGGIKGFFFKIILFFQKIFKSNRECKCGIAHY